MSNLIVGKYGHACTVLNSNIIVSGGYIHGTDQLTATTEIISILTGTPKPGGNLKTARVYFAMLTLGGLYPKVLAIGGFVNSGLTDSIEEWVEDKETWKISPITLSTGKFKLGAVAIPPAVICP